MLAHLLFSILFLISSANAGLITIPLKDSEQKFAPASDLVYEGRRIDEVTAMDLEKTGVDLSLLNPYESDLFKLNSVAISKPQTVREVHFHSLLQSPTEFFRFASKVQDKAYTVTASLFNHETIVRANLLKQIGYNIPDIFYQQETVVRFDSVSEMDLFLEKLVDSTLLSKKRWITEENRANLSLKMRGLLLEPADATSVPVYWPIMEETRQRKRRVFRSLFYLYTLTDFNMPINEISWSLGKIFNKQLILSHPYADDFSSVTTPDLQWIHRKIMAIPETRLCLGIKEAHYPDDIAQLLCEKLKSRINTLGKSLGVASSFSVNTQASYGQVQNGKLTSGNYPDFVPVFWTVDAENPYRFSEIFKFFRTQVMYDTIASTLDTVEEKFLPNITAEEAYSNIIDRVKEHGKEHGSVPLKVWSAPTAGASVGGSRTIVFGKYDGSVAPIQLVDSLFVKANIGVFSFLSIPGNPVTPTARLNVQLARTWRHVKAMPDLTTATSQKVKKLLIPKLYKNLGQLLEVSPKCSLNEDAWTTEEIVAGIGVSIVYYDQANETAKTRALILREELIGKGIPKNKILLRPVIREELCLKEITEKRNKNIEEFLKSFAADETLTVTDALETVGAAGVKVSDSIVDGLKLEAGLEGGPTVLRSYIIRKTESGIEITVQNQIDLSAKFYQEGKFLINLMSNATVWTDGNQHAKVYRVNFDGADDEQKKIAVQVLREVFLRNSFGLLSDNYNAIKMDHDAKVRLNTFKFFWFKNERLKMNHEVEVIIPNRETQREIPTDDTVDEWTVPEPLPTNLSEKERTRNLFSTMSLNRKGSDYHGFLNQILNDKVEWLSTGSGVKDPGQSIKGKSSHSYTITEGNLTEGFDFNPVTKIEYGNAGWSASLKDLEKLLQTHEGYLSTKEEPFKIDRTIFNQTSLLRSYDMRTTILFYPKATQKILAALLKTSETEAIATLKNWYGAKEWDRYCRRVEDTQDDYSWYESEKKRGDYYCVPSKLIEILNMRKNGIPSKRQTFGLQINNVVKILMETVQRKNLLSWVGKDHFFGSSYISGFRNGDSLGYIQYGSDTVGTYDKELETGIFDQVAGLLGIRGYSLKGMVYTPNM